MLTGDQKMEDKGWRSQNSLVYIFISKTLNHGKQSQHADVEEHYYNSFKTLLFTNRASTWWLEKAQFWPSRNFLRKSLSENLRKFPTEWFLRIIHNRSGLVESLKFSDKYYQFFIRFFFSQFNITILNQF